MTQTYPSSGKTTIAIDVLLAIARLTALNVPGVSRLVTPAGVKGLFKRSQHQEGVSILVEDDTVSADLYLTLKNDVNIREVCRTVQHDVARAISEMVGMQVGRIDIHVEDIDYVAEPADEPGG
jgi:uncharacterized alkaline shock family protein YloU